MIDTVILTIPRKDFITITDPQSPLWELHSKRPGFEKYVKNQTFRQKNDGIYRPRIRVIKRGLLSLLQIEFSVPKLIFANNVDEVCEKDFENIIQTLQMRLRDFGIVTEKNALANASVSVFHPSKNILLSSGYTASGIIKEIRKVNLTKRMDLNRDSFRNDGQSIQLYTNSHSLVIYDKIRDLEKPQKRAIDKDQPLIQLSLFNQLDAINKQTEILRIEIRLCNKTKMNQILVKNGFSKNPTFEELFKTDLCKKIVYQYWNELITDRNLFLFSMDSNPKQVLRRLIQHYPLIKPKEAIYLIGLHQLSRDEDGIRELRNYVEKQSSQRTWYRTSKDLQKLNVGQKIKHCQGWVKQVNNQLMAFTPLKIHSLLCKAL